MELKKTFESLEEMAQFLRENGYYVVKEVQPVQPYMPAYPVYPQYPIYPAQPIWVSGNDFPRGTIVCEQHASKKMN